MPTTYTHYVYGQEIFESLPKEIQKEILPFINYYNIGVHGPDILFYYRSFHKNHMNQYGVKVHHEAMSRFLNHAFFVYKKQKKKKEAFAYLAGFMTHFILDSSCHPYIGKRIRETGISHTEIETDWDSLVIKRKGYDPVRHKTACHIHLNKKYGNVIAPYYKKTSRQICTGLRYMRFILNHVFRSPFGIKQRLAVFINTRFFPKECFQHYFRKRRINPEDKETCKELIKLYDGSKKLCVPMIVEMYQALQKNDLTFCEKKYFERDFS